MNLQKREKAELIKNGTLQRYKEMLSEVYNAGFEPSSDPADYHLTEQEKDLCDRLLLSTKKKKQKFRNHTWFMHQYYEHVGFLTLTYSDETRDNSALEWKKESVTEILSKCFSDYIGKPELSPSGKLHFHFIVAWNGTLDPVIIKRNGIEYTNIRKADLQQLWYGTYGIYELTLLPSDRTSSNKAANYAMKSLNTMDSYILKDEELDLKNIVSDELIYAVNTSNIMVKRDTPYHKWNKAYTEQKKFIKHQCRVFDTPFYEDNKYAKIDVFKEWATRHIGTRATDYCEIIPKDFKLIDIKNF